MFLIASKAPDASAKADAAWRRALAEGKVDDPARLAAFMLEKVSRTFALNIRVLPTRLRRQILLAYLFCRMADTLEDDAALSTRDKVDLLQAFRRLFPPGPGFRGAASAGAGPKTNFPPGPDWAARIEEFAAIVPSEWKDSDRWDHLLVFHCRHIFPQLREFPDAAVAAISACVDEMSLGMVRFTEKQAAAAEGAPLIASLKDLDDYCYYVAGTVGNMLCDLFSLHSPLIGKKRAKALKALAVSFGLGLQLTNILKDIHDDRERNVSYIPQDLLAAHDLTQATFLAADRRAEAARVLERLLRKARTHLEDALSYTCLLPRLEPRLRLFCLWPLFMAAETLVLLAGNRHALRETAKLKISREAVGAIVRRTSVACWSNRLIRALFDGTSTRLEAALASSGLSSADAGGFPGSALTAAHGGRGPTQRGASPGKAP